MAKKASPAQILSFDTHPLPSWIYNKKTGEILASNNAAVKFSGYSRAQLKKLVLSDIIQVVSAKGSRNKVRCGMLTQKSGQRSNVQCYFSVSVVKGKKHHVLITHPVEQKSQEADLNALVAEYTSNPVMLLDSAGLITWVNPRFEQLTGYLLHDVLGKMPGQVLHGPETSPNTINMMVRNLSRQLGYRTEVLNYTKSGKSFWVDMEVKPLKGRGDDVTGYLVILLDITQMKIAIAEMLKSQEQLQTIVNNIPMDVFMKDLKGRYTFYNRSFEQHFLKNNRASAFTDFDLFNNEEAENLSQNELEVIKCGETVRMEQDINHGSQTDTYYTVKFPLYDWEQRMYGIGGVFLQITERKQMELKLKESEARYRSIVEDQIEMICRYDRDYNLTFVNTAYAAAFGYRKDELIGKSFLQFIPDDEKERVKHYVKRIFQGEDFPKPVEQLSYINNEPHWIAWFDMPLRDERGEIYEIQSIGHEITHRKELEREQARLEKIVRESYNEIYIINDKTLAIEFANSTALKNLGYRLEELNELRLPDLFTYPDEMALQALLNSLRKTETDRLQLQLRQRRKDRSPYDVEVLIQVLEKDESLVVIASDITSKLVTEHKLMDTIYEKETLIKEIHHRVKNNLQLISSIIFLKMATLGQSDIRTFLENTRQKIRSIALIHERLLQSEKLDKVEISDYLGKLIHDLQVTYFREDLALDIKTNIQEKIMGLDTAIICGLIVNELVTNAIKHAFTGRSTGLITITFIYDEAQNQNLLEVRDNGVSLPAHISPGSINSFGMQLIDVFVKQLGGSFEIIRENGTIFLIRFSLQN